MHTVSNNHLEYLPYGLWALSRPAFLVGTVPLYSLGVSAAWHDLGSVYVWPVALGELALWLIQLLLMAVLGLDLRTSQLSLPCGCWVELKRST